MIGETGFQGVFFQVWNKILSYSVGSVPCFREGSSIMVLVEKTADWVSAGFVA